MLSSRLLPSFALAAVCLVPALLPAQSATEKADAVAGAALFRNAGCVQCHGADIKGTKKGPALTNIRLNKLWTPNKMRDQMLNGGEKMPPFADSLTDDQIGQLIVFLRAKHPPAVPPAPAPKAAAQ